ncbi:MAG TPA: hypothetical protein VF458_19275 [Ktedonobacteraceae bacterium]
MDVTLSVNLWFLISLCLFCALAGVIYGVTVRRRHERELSRYYDHRDRDRVRY